MTLRDQIVEQALTLPPDDREFVADILEQSLETHGFATPEITAEWAAEIARRLAAYERGETSACDASTAMQEMRSKLAARRTGNSQ